MGGPLNFGRLFVFGGLRKPKLRERLKTKRRSLAPAHDTPEAAGKQSRG
jgi:hypothetical protein